MLWALRVSILQNGYLSDLMQYTVWWITWVSVVWVWKCHECLSCIMGRCWQERRMHAIKRYLRFFSIETLHHPTIQECNTKFGFSSLWSATVNFEHLKQSTPVILNSVSFYIPYSPTFIWLCCVWFHKWDQLCFSFCTAMFKSEHKQIRQSVIP